MLSPRRLMLEYDTEVPSPKSTWRLVDKESPYRKKQRQTDILYGFTSKYWGREFPPLCLCSLTFCSVTLKVILVPITAVSWELLVLNCRPLGAMGLHCCILGLSVSFRPSLQLFNITFRYLNTWCSLLLAETHTLVTIFLHTLHGDVPRIFYCLALSTRINLTIYWKLFAFLSRHHLVCL